MAEARPPSARTGYFPASREVIKIIICHCCQLKALCQINTFYCNTDWIEQMGLYLQLMDVELQV